MSRAGRYRGVVFDLDGTLVDSMPLVLGGLASAVEPFRPRPERAEIMNALGGPSEACVLRLLGSTKHLAAALAAYLEFLRKHEDRTRPFRGVRRLLEDLRVGSVRLGIWTGRERASTQARLRALSLEQYFDPLVCGDDLASHKPDPAGLRQIIRRWGLTPGEVLFVGDSDQDLAGGAAAGVSVVAIQSGRRLASGVRRQALAVAATPAAAYAWVRDLVLAAE